MADLTLWIAYDCVVFLLLEKSLDGFAYHLMSLIRRD